MLETHALTKKRKKVKRNKKKTVVITQTIRDFNPDFPIERSRYDSIHFCFRLTGLMADILGSYTHAFYMSGAVVIAGACISFLLLFTKTREPGELFSDLWGLNEAMKEIATVAMDTEQGEETQTDSSSRENFIVCTSAV